MLTAWPWDESQCCLSGHTVMKSATSATRRKLNSKLVSPVVAPPQCAVPDDGQMRGTLCPVQGGRKQRFSCQTGTSLGGMLRGCSSPRANPERALLRKGPKVGSKGVHLASSPNSTSPTFLKRQVTSLGHALRHLQRNVHRPT